MRSMWRISLATCALCKKAHPANYKGCEYAAKSRRATPVTNGRSFATVAGKKPQRESSKEDQEPPRKGSIEEGSEAFPDSLERQCRFSTHPDDDEEFEEAVERIVRMMRGDQAFQGIEFTAPDKTRDSKRRTITRRAVTSKCRIGY